MQINIQGGNRAQYGRSIQKMDHNLLGTDLFGYQNLLTALDEHPPEMLDICVPTPPRPGPVQKASFSTCARGSATGEQLIQAVSRGDLWLNMRGLETLETPYGNLVHTAHKTFRRHMNVSMGQRAGSLVISSPRARIDYHVDLKEVTLWNLRGKRRIFIYPSRSPFIRPEYIQAMALQDRGFEAGVETIPYIKEFEPYGIAIDLEPGEMICWPYLSPYRIKNLGAINVSMALEGMTLPARMRLGTYFFDGFANRVSKAKWTGHDTTPIKAFSKWTAAGVIKQAGIIEQRRKDLRPAFKLNLARPNCLEPI